MSKTPSITISAHRDGYRRLGVAHGAAAKDLAGRALESRRRSRSSAPIRAWLWSMPARKSRRTESSQPRQRLKPPWQNAVSALRQATPAEIRNFFRAVSDDSDLQEKIELAMDRTRTLLHRDCRAGPGQSRSLHQGRQARSEGAGKGQRSWRCQLPPSAMMPGRTYQKAKEDQE